MMLRFLSGQPAAGPRAQLSVLTFHRVLPEFDPLQTSEPSVAQFERWIAGWSKWFRFRLLSEAVHDLRNGTLREHTACITFDDGYANNLDLAAPILQRLGVPATFFIATGFSRGGMMFNDKLTHVFRQAKGSEIDLSVYNLGRWPVDCETSRRESMNTVIRKLKHLKYAEREALSDAIVMQSNTTVDPHPMMSFDQIKLLANMGFEIGAHTVSHPILRELPDGEAENEIRTSREELKALTGQKVQMFAYPNGRPGDDYDLRHTQMVKNAGFIGAVSTIPGAASKQSDLYQIPRFTPWYGASWRSGLQFLRNYRTPIRALRPD
jgi:peptidoglycan/xylan/chitin deacetylase (PgdA/CDA1 family)